MPLDFSGSALAGGGGGVGGGACIGAERSSVGGGAASGETASAALLPSPSDVTLIFFLSRQVRDQRVLHFEY